MGKYYYILLGACYIFLAASMFLAYTNDSINRVLTASSFHLWVFLIGYWLSWIGGLLFLAIGIRNIKKANEAR